MQSKNEAVTASMIAVISNAPKCLEQIIGKESELRDISG